MNSLGKYSLIQQLGAGSMGTVYLARDTVLDREVALKTIRTGEEVDAEVRERFYREARTCARLQHPNIVTIFDLGEQDKVAYIAMELLQGTDFRKIIEGPFDADVATKVEAMIQICEALSYAHRQGIVHRDVKPSNLFLGNGNRATVLDFGIARLPSSRLTVVGRVLGTPNYMAPEQILGKPSDGRSDLFSAAVVFFELLVHQHPFRSALVPRRIVDGEPDSVFDHDSSLPLPFEKIFARGMAKDPSRRYATGDEMAGDLQAVLDGLRHNSSPRFSQFALPSMRAPVAVEGRELPVLNPMGEIEPEERQLSDFLKTLPHFERAIEEHDLPVAEATLRRLRSVSSNDSRFTESVRLCADRLAKLKAISAGFHDSQAKTTILPVPVQEVQEPSGRGLQGESITQFIRSTVSATRSEDHQIAPERWAEKVDRHDVSCARCGSANRSEASFCTDCGGNLRGSDTAGSGTADSKASKPTKWLAGDGGGDFARTISGLSAFSRRALAHLNDLWPFFARRAREVVRRKPATVLACAGVCLAVLLSLYFLQSRIRLEASIGTAFTKSDQTKLLRSMDDESASAASLPRGSLVNILTLPDSPGQRFLSVQPMMDGKPFPKGYVDRRALTNWKCGKAETALSLARLLGPSMAGSEDDLRRQIDGYESVIGNFPASAQALTAKAEEARLLLEVGRRTMINGGKEAEWRTLAVRAKSLATNISSRPQADALIREADALIAPETSSSANSSPAPMKGADSNAQVLPPMLGELKQLTKAKTLYSNYEYAPAIKILDDYLARHPRDKNVRALRTEMQRAKAAEENAR